ncbi:hypothetical protein PSH03_003112 [Micromonospora sp. PSH03]|uniref:hypothetical protein n=1 Tax=Micromonospora TaxID=1873 RepID=UPI001B379296|nr:MULTISPECIES: hypothetical protein [Micromonospora]MBQ0992802.1 hypothetical protein [Micromonospora sp. H61]MCG5457991.1 hypothetical protein [Micromonospora salmantinae]
MAGTAERDDAVLWTTNATVDNALIMPRPAMAADGGYAVSVRHRRCVTRRPAQKRRVDLVLILTDVRWALGNRHQIA